MRTPTYCEDLDCEDFLVQVYGDGKFCRAWHEDLESVDLAHTVPCEYCELDTNPRGAQP